MLHKNKNTFFAMEWNSKMFDFVLSDRFQDNKIFNAIESFVFREDI